MSITPDTEHERPAPLLPVDIYRDVHKGLRRALFATTELAGRTADDVDGAVADLLTAVDGMQQLLRWHHHHEDTLVQPTLDDRLPELAREVRDEHDAIEAHMTVVDRLVTAIATAAAAERTASIHALYLELASFTGRYLTHQDLEERHVMVALSHSMGLDALSDLDLAIRSAVPLDQMLHFLQEMVPAMPPSERVTMLDGMRTAMPPAVFAPVLAAASAALDDRDRLDLTEGLGPGS